MVLTVAGLIVIIYFWHYITGLQAYGYLGAFLMALVAGSSIPIPISYIVVTFTLGSILSGSILSPILVGVASGVGAGTGGTLVFLFGRGGSRFVPKINHFSLDEAASSRGVKIMNKFMYWAQRRGTLVVFVMSAMFNPMFAPMAITMGALRFRMIKFFAMCVAGNIVKSLIIKSRQIAEHNNSESVLNYG